MPLGLLGQPGRFVNFLIILCVMIAACISLHEHMVWNITRSVLMVPFSFVLYILPSTSIAAWVVGLPL